MTVVKTGSAGRGRWHAKEADLQQSCGTGAGVRCDVVSLWRHLRLCIAISDIRTCGWCLRRSLRSRNSGRSGANLNFPRFDYDIGMVRAYENDKPGSDSRRLGSGARRDRRMGDLVFAPGSLGGTSRESTMAQLGDPRHVVSAVGIGVRGVSGAAGAVRAAGTGAGARRE